jgi:cobalamin 5'-phosphate synthase/cobalamin synthase
VKSLLAAIAFLTRFPIAEKYNFDTADVARSAGWFPLVGLLLGSIYSLVAFLLRNHLPTGLVAVVLVIVDVVLTGALHFDGLADTADGFGGGKSIEDILRIMRDHAIGSYGGVALTLLVALKVTAYAALIKQSNWIPAVMLTPVLGRWSILLLTGTLPYARLSTSVIQNMGKQSLFWGTVLMVAPTLALMSTRVWFATGAVIIVTVSFGFYCKRRIAGITGDTLGANLQLCECISLFTFLWVPNPH